MHHFVAGNTVTYQLDTTVRAEGDSWGVPGKEITTTFRVVSFVQMESGQVIRHIDFADYDQAAKQIEAQKAASDQE